MNTRATLVAIALTTLAARHQAEGLPAPYRIAGALQVTDQIMSHGFWIGVYPGLTSEMREYVADVLREFVRSS